MAAQALRSGKWFDRADFGGWVYRSFLRAEGFTEESFRGRPVIGICNTFSEIANCNAHLRELAEHVKRGILQAGGFPLEFPVISLAEVLMTPTTMLYRNLMAMDVEESLRANPLDGVVLLAGCDKTTPACLMGAASADLPSVVLTGGPMLNGRWSGRSVGACTDCHRLYYDLRAGRITPEEYRRSEGSITRSTGHCQTMGTASTMACVTEALGMALPGSAAIPAPDARRKGAAELAGRAAVDLAVRGVKPSQIIDAQAMDNAIRVLHAIGGSTNAVVHLISIAGRLGLPLSLDRFDELSQTTPWLVNVRPSGEYLMEEFFDAGGVPAVMGELGSLINREAATVTGKTVAENIGEARSLNTDVIASATKPLAPDGALVVLRGNLAPRGALIKRSAANPRLLRHEGRAVVLEMQEVGSRMDDPDLPVDADTVLVMRGAGPIGAPGMPEAGHLPIPKKLLKAGVNDLVRISDARISGTAFGALVVHVAPESAVGGPLALVRDGDHIRLDVDERRLDLLVGDDELDRRRLELPPAEYGRERGWLGLYRRHVLQADEGCDLDFLRGSTPTDTASEWMLWADDMP